MFYTVGPSCTLLMLLSLATDLSTLARSLSQTSCALAFLEIH